ncbi:hypothetical protein [Variovorax sp. EL159]|uniref:hypothetical protein n=1 Tax=Variovorax sp. EL159 TaxID=1566270 RepID=UPI0008879F82|nr:hypothetical protein [Variovorax sp. EL159]SCX72616.1 hypothetical protein SAMN03159363_4336 [Variovorax sp. EL159]
MQTQSDPTGDIIHLAVCVERLSSCHLTLQDVRANLDHPLSGPAFRYAVVEYMTLFNQSKDGQGHPRRIPVGCVPVNHVALHERLKKTRNELLAHSDMSALDGSLDFKDIRGLPITTTTLTHADDLAELKNVDEFLDLIQTVRDNVFAKRATLLAGLPSA